jgi:hypothetical protein
VTPLFFYSYWPLGYHNLEAERKAIAFARAGYDVVYVAGVGIRNPRAQSAAKLLDRAAAKLRRPGGAPAAAQQQGEVRSASVLVAPPRQLPLVRHANTAWMERQLRGIFDDWSEAVAWVRWPTPELVDALARLRPKAVVYECVDAYHISPGITGRWVEVFEQAERRLVDLSTLCVTPSEPLAERLREFGARVEVVPHGVDLDPWDGPVIPTPGPTTVGFVGTLDYKLEDWMLRGIAQELPDWRMRLIGPVQEGFDARKLADLPNVSVEPPIPADDVARTIASFDVGVMPYFDHPAYTASCPLKNLEYMGMGKAAVARWAPALEPYRDLLYFASEPAEFARELRRAVAEDTPELQRRRRAVAEANTWQRRLGELTELVDGLAGAPRGAPTRV